uniref:DUF975 family protein n=1 Tax=Treponema sp. TaxID=166 RepID=UPI00388E21FA
LWLFLWSLLFFFPAVIKFYSYLMMHYVIAENPEIKTDKAMKISIILTEGHKAELFSMHLSFFGWFLLCCFTQGIGLIFLIPYVKMTELNAYYYLKQKAFAENRLSPADFK